MQGVKRAVQVPDVWGNGATGKYGMACIWIRVPVWSPVFGVRNGELPRTVERREGRKRRRRPARSDRLSSGQESPVRHGARRRPMLSCEPSCGRPAASKAAREGPVTVPFGVCGDGTSGVVAASRAEEVCRRKLGRPLLDSKPDMPAVLIGLEVRAGPGESAAHATGTQCAGGRFPIPSAHPSGYPAPQAPLTTPTAHDTHPSGSSA